MFFQNLTIITIMLRVPAILIAFAVHEFFHGYAAYLLGDMTAQRDGRLSLNPMRHLDPLGTIMLLIVGFGWAKPVMINPYNLRNPKQDMAIIALAGPLSNFAMAFVAIFIGVGLAFNLGGGNPIDVLQNHLYLFNNVQQFTARGLLFNFIGVFAIINLSLGIFNLLPIPPLDGSKIFTFFLPDELYFRFISFRYGFFILIALVLTNIVGVVLSMGVTALWDMMAWLPISIFS